MAYTFTPITVGTTTNFISVCCSQDGTIVYACNSGGRCWKSVDSGATFVEIQPAGNTTKSWVGIACSSDGQKVVAVESRIYYSSNGGTSWGEETPFGSNNKGWQFVAMDGAGNFMAGTYTEGFASKYNGSWNTTPPKANGYWVKGAMSRDSSHWFATCDAEYIYLSTDHGASWTVIHPDGGTATNFFGLGLDNDGTVQAAAKINGRFYLSTNDGASWAQKLVAGNADTPWRFIRASDDGSVIIAVNYQKCFVSRDSGANWAEVQPAGATTKTWQSCALGGANDNNIYFVNAGENKIYVGTWAEEVVPSTFVPQIMVI